MCVYTYVAFDLASRSRDDLLALAVEGGGFPGFETENLLRSTMFGSHGSARGRDRDPSPADSAMAEAARALLRPNDRKARVLVVYTGGTLGMRKRSDGGFFFFSYAYAHRRF